MNRMIEWDVYTIRYDTSNVGPSFLYQLIPGKDSTGVPHKPTHYLVL